MGAALRELLTEGRALRQLLCSLLGDDAELDELACMLSEPGARRQPVHPDSPAVGVAHGVGDEGRIGHAGSRPSLSAAGRHALDGAHRWRGTPRRRARRVETSRAARAPRGARRDALEGDALVFDSHKGENRASDGTRARSSTYPSRGRRPPRASRAPALRGLRVGTIVAWWRPLRSCGKCSRAVGK